MSFIWATRGRTWGFRFLCTANHPNPLTVYEMAFAGLEDAPTVFRPAGGTVAVRFPDPEGRRDRAGRVIPHDFVVLAPGREPIQSVESAQLLLWPRVAQAFSEVWDRAAPPPETQSPCA